jgi:hypothetical protein
MATCLLLLLMREKFELCNIGNGTILGLVDDGLPYLLMRVVPDSVEWVARSVVHLRTFSNRIDLKRRSQQQLAEALLRAGYEVYQFDTMSEFLIWAGGVANN